MRHKIITLACVLPLVAVAGCYSWLVGDCADNVKSQSVSPDGRYIARLVERDCGATTDYSTVVDLRLSSESLDSHQDNWILTMPGRHSITLTWQGNTELMIMLPQSRTVVQKTAWGDVEVTYQHSN